MIEQKKQFKLPDAKKPILVCKEVPELKDVLNINSEYYLCSTLDRRVSLVEYSSDNEKFMSYSYDLKVNQLPTQLYIDVRSNYLYVGYLNGDIQWFNYIEKFSHISGSSIPRKKQKTYTFKQPKPSSDTKIMLIYTRGNYIFAWDDGSRFKKISVTTSELIQTYKFEEEYCSSTYFKNPFTHSTACCIAFLGRSPIIFDSDTKSQFLNDYELSLVSYSEDIAKPEQNGSTYSFSMENKESKKQQIIFIQAIYDKHSEKMLMICSVKQQTRDEHFIIIYEVIKQEQMDISVCQVQKRFQLKSPILSVHMKNNIIMVSMINSMQFIKFDGNQMISIYSTFKEGLNLCWGFILELNEQHKIKFLIEKGFNYLIPEERWSAPKFRIKTKKIQWKF